MVIIIGAELAVRRQKSANAPNHDPTDPDENHKWAVTYPPGAAGPPTGGEGLKKKFLQDLETIRSMILLDLACKITMDFGTISRDIMPE